jgi:hypothetical protein
VTTAPEAAALAERLKLRLPLVRAVDDVLHGRAGPRAALEEVLRLDIELEREALSPGRA